MSMTRPDIERYERYGVPCEPEPDRFLCPLCELEWPLSHEVTTKNGMKVCKHCSVACDGCGAIYTFCEVEPVGQQRMCWDCARDPLWLRRRRAWRN